MTIKNAKCEKCSGIGYINDEYSGTLICDCSFKAAGFGVSRPADQPDKTYLGDGVYVVAGHGEITLTTENGVAATNRIYMDIGVIMTLVDYLKTRGLL